MILGFVASDACVLAVQAGLVAAPRRALGRGAFGRWLQRRESRWWALVPIGSIVLVIIAIDVASGTANGLTWLAFVAVPILAAAAFGWASHGARWWLSWLAAPLLAIAWIWPHRIEGQLAAMALTAFSCVTLGVLLASVCPPAWLKVGIVLMAAADAYLVLSDLLQQPNNQLVVAVGHIGGLRLPQLQGVTFQDVLLGYGDLFIAAVLGGVLAREGRRQWPVAILTGLIAGAFDLLFFVLSELPATVPVALALIAVEAWAWSRRRAGGRVGRSQWGSSPVEAGGRDSSASDVIARVPRAASSSTSVASSAERE
jgi:hypothetical protein